MPERPEDIERLVREEQANLKPEERQGKPEAKGLDKDLIGNVLRAEGVAPANQNEAVDTADMNATMLERMQMKDAAMQKDEAAVREVRLELNLPEGVHPSQVKGRLPGEAKPVDMPAQPARGSMEASGLELDPEALADAKKRGGRDPRRDAEAMKGFIATGVVERPKPQAAPKKKSVVDTVLGWFKGDKAA